HRRSKLYIACSDFFQSQSALMPLLLLSKSNPLCWVLIWFSLTEATSPVLPLRPQGRKACFAALSFHDFGKEASSPQAGLDPFTAILPEFCVIFPSRYSKLPGKQAKYSEKVTITKSIFCVLR
ncbi:hypothetical protein, partial [Dysosmobacter sp.]|uniref:hypothetical protein n=1 Tax=Dysosmobacter sp. TaxID=2591382 RepID=UPI003FD763F7